MPPNVAADACDLENDCRNRPLGSFCVHGIVVDLFCSLYKMLASHLALLGFDPQVAAFCLKPVQHKDVVGWFPFSANGLDDLVSNDTSQNRTDR